MTTVGRTVVVEWCNNPLKIVPVPVATSYKKKECLKLLYLQISALKLDNFLKH